MGFLPLSPKLKTITINNAINIERAFPNLNEYTDIRLDFRNSTTLKPIYLNNVAMSVFDVDYSDTYSAYFDDKVRITGITQSGSVIDGTLQTIAGSNLVYNQGKINSEAMGERLLFDRNW